MSTATDNADAMALERIGREPGVKRSQLSRAGLATAATRLIRKRLVNAPNTSGRLYLTAHGQARYENQFKRPDGTFSHIPLS